MSQKLLISFLAVFNDGAFLMVSEALFQSLAESLLKLNLAALVLASSFQTFIELFLMLLNISLTAIHDVKMMFTRSRKRSF